MFEWNKKEEPIRGLIGMGGGYRLAPSSRPTLGLISSNPATNAKAILDANGGTAPNGDGLYWITVNGSAKQVWCDMTAPAHNTGSSPGGWMMVYKVDADSQASCTNNTWDFPLTSGYGGSNPPTSPYGAISNGQGEGLSRANRWSFWGNSTSCPNQRLMVWSGRSTSVDVKVELLGNYDNGNAMYGFASGEPNMVTGYSNAYYGTNQGRCRYNSGYQTGISAGNDYQIYQLGHWSCGCCESIHYNGGYNDGSTDVSMLFGDGRYNANQRAFDWCCFFVR